MRLSLFVIFLTMMTVTTHAQSPYLTLPDPKNPEHFMWVGSFSMNAFMNDTACKWFPSGMADFKPNKELVTNIAAAKSENHLLIFAGTWCDDSQFILPRLYNLLSAAEFPESHISLYGVDRNKKTIGNIAAAFGITNVPTIIVMKAGKEVGRVVEYGKTGKWDNELAELFK